MIWFKQNFNIKKEHELCASNSHGFEFFCELLVNITCILFVYLLFFFFLVWLWQTLLLDLVATVVRNGFANYCCSYMNECLNLFSFFCNFFYNFEYLQCWNCVNELSSYKSTQVCHVIRELKNIKTLNTGDSHRIY